jgi:hypothetical protein
MLTKFNALPLSICILSLSACTFDGTSPSTYYQGNASETSLYPEGYEGVGGYNVQSMPDERVHDVVVPESYHVSTYGSPTPSKDLDKNWVTSQNPQSYTIELAQSDKASQVAGTLYKAPKNEHTAEVKSQRYGKTYYQGLYGTYSSYEAAQQALNSLPEDLKQNAGIKTWGSVQSTVSE